MSGDAQRGFVGTALDSGAFVIVTDASGAPVGSARVHFTAGATVDTVIATGPDGKAGYLWTLGSQPGQQSLEVRIDDSTVRSLSFTAQAYLLSQADLVVVHNASAGTVMVLDVIGPSRVVSHSLTWPDTVLRLVPRDSNTSQGAIAAFELGNLPDNAPSPWTPGTDTIHLRLGAVFPLPITVWILHDFATTVAIADSDLANLNLVWQSNPFGLQVGPVRFIDATNSPAAKPFVCQSTLPGADPTTVNVYYLPIDPNGTVGDFGLFGGYACDARTILVGPHSLVGDPWLLPHEFGHTFGLPHVTDPANLMNPRASGSMVTASQIHTSLFAPFSSINSVYGLFPSAPVSLDQRRRYRGP